VDGDTDTAKKRTLVGSALHDYQLLNDINIQAIYVFGSSFCWSRSLGGSIDYLYYVYITYPLRLLV